MPIASVTNERFPDDISYGSKGGPGFSTTVFTSTSGEEQRNSNWSRQRCRFDASYGIRTIAQMDNVIAFFYAMRGKAQVFRFKDWSDFKIKNGTIGTGNASQTQYQIIKNYSVSSSSFSRIINRIVNGTVSVYFGTTLKTPITDYSVNYDTGIITFTVAPPATTVINVTCEFDVPVRFDIDELNITLEDFELETISNIPLIEVKL
jgi:uncharacterized protein (TIGR02217 family)